MSLNVDDLLSQNKFLHESNRNLRQEISNLKKPPSKSNMDSNSSISVNNEPFIEHVFKKADAYLKISDAYLKDKITNTGQQASQAYEIIQELKDLAENFFENLNNKLIAGIHQRRVIFMSIYRGRF